DDMESMTKSIRGMLKVLKYGKKFYFANDGRAALSVLEKRPVDLVITDLNMPIMTGVELLSAIRENDKLKDMPIVMITAEANREAVAEAAETDIDSYILKPLTVKSLGTRIADVVERTNNPPPMISHLRRAREYENVGDFDAAIKEAKLAVDADPLSTRPIRELGGYFYKTGDLAKAEKQLLKAAGMN
ncbi:MAG: response regulator, partial [bacterium]|nr:response regulator [bacterium]